MKRIQIAQRKKELAKRLISRRKWNDIRISTKLKLSRQFITDLRLEMKIPPVRKKVSDRKSQKVIQDILERKLTGKQIAEKHGASLRFVVQLKTELRKLTEK